MNKGGKSPWCRVGHRAQGDWGARWRGGAQLEREDKSPSLPFPPHLLLCLTHPKAGAPEGLSGVTPLGECCPEGGLCMGHLWIWAAGNRPGDLDSDMAPWGCFPAVEACTQVTLPSSLPAPS